MKKSKKENWPYWTARKLGYPAHHAKLVLDNYRQGFWHPCLGVKPGAEAFYAGLYGGGR